MHSSAPILKIKWDHFITNDDVLEQARAEDFDDSCPEQSELVGRSLLRYKGTVKDILKRGDVLQTWRDTADNRSEWRELILHSI